MSITITKIVERRKGDPDYSIDGEKFQIQMYPTSFNVLEWVDTLWTSKHRINIDEGHSYPLYHLLESEGNASIALCYMEYLDNFHPFYNIKDLPMLSSGVMIGHLVHYMIWEPDKIIWQRGGLKRV
jgi:hypothetical protein